MNVIYNNYETTIKTLLEYGFSWDEVEYYARNPKELEKIFEKIANSEKLY